MKFELKLKHIKKSDIGYSEIIEFGNSIYQTSGIALQFGKGLQWFFKRVINSNFFNTSKPENSLGPEIPNPSTPNKNGGNYKDEDQPNNEFPKCNQCGLVLSDFGVCHSCNPNAYDPIDRT